MIKIKFVLLLIGTCCIIISQTALIDEFEQRRHFHEKVCRKYSDLSTCKSPFTMEDYRNELRNFYKKYSDEEVSQKTKRSDWSSDDSDLDDQEFEYYMWRKRRRQMLREGDGDQWYNSHQPDYHYHYHEAPHYYPQYSGSYYPSYGGYGGYGGGYGGYGGGYGRRLFGFGLGRSIGISTPIGGFGYRSGFGFGFG